VLVELTRPDDRSSERVVVDPNLREPKGRVTIDFYEPSPDGKLVAVSLSKNGSEDGTLHVFEVATGRELPDRIARIQYPTAGGSVAWAAGSDAVYYTRYPRKGEKPDADLAFFQEVWRHELGTPESADRYEMGRGLPRIARPARAGLGTRGGDERVDGPAHLGGVFEDRRERLAIPRFVARVAQRQLRARRQARQRRAQLVGELGGEALLVPQARGQALQQPVERRRACVDAFADPLLLRCQIHSATRG